MKNFETKKLIKKKITKMKFLLIACAIIGFAAAAQVPDSATQGPNPQDIATPEPEYIDIDGPEPAGAPAPAPAPVQTRSFAPIPAPIISRPVAAQSQQYFAPQRVYHAPAQQVVHHQQYQQLPGHSFSSHSGYQYRRPVYIRRVYRRRRY